MMWLICVFFCGQFLPFLSKKRVCINVSLYDLVHNVIEDCILRPLATGNSIWESFLGSAVGLPQT